MKFCFVFILIPFWSFGQSLKFDGPIRFLAMGDSYTIGQSVPENLRWPRQLADSLAVRGYPTDSLRLVATTGWRTDNLLNALSNQNLSQGNFNLVSVLIGVNNQYQNRPFSQFQIEFPQLLDSALLFAGGDSNRVFVVSIPDYAYTPFGIQIGNGPIISGQVDQYNAFKKQLAIQYGIPFFDITGISRLGLSQPGMVASDGLHPSGFQYTLWVNEILKFVDSVMILQKIEKTLPRNTLKIWPNPVNNQLMVQNDIEGEFETPYFIFNSFGQKVIHGSISRGQRKIEVSQIPEGVYSLAVLQHNRRYGCRVVKVDKK